MFSFLVRWPRFLQEFYSLCVGFLGFILQNTIFIKTTIIKTAAIPTQKPISMPKKDTEPNRFIQIVAQSIVNTSYS